MFAIPKSVEDEAKRGLAWRARYGRGGTAVGLRTAHLLARGGSLSESWIRYIARYFPRHAWEKSTWYRDGVPSNGRIAWALWGGDAARKWTGSIVTRLGPPMKGTAKNMARDPRTFLELRRLARQAQRNPDALAVLQDALLETLPAYAKAIAEADERSDGLYPWNVWFFPTRLNPVTRKHGTTELAFEVQRAFVDRNDLNASSRSRQDVGQALIVYETMPTKDLVYEDPQGDGRGQVVDRGGRILGYRYSARGRGPHWSSARYQSIGALDTAFLRWMRWWLMHHYTRHQLIDWLRWNDPNGSYSDEEEEQPLTHQEAADLAFEHVLETKETLEEMRQNARR